MLFFRRYKKRGDIIMSVEITIEKDIDAICDCGRELSAMWNTRKSVNRLPM
jgi:hypothetical protein